MSTLSPPANRLLLAVAAVVLAWTTTLPWYAPSAKDPKPTDGPVEQAAWQVARLFQDVAGTRTASAALLVGAAAAVVVVAALTQVARTPLFGDLLKLLGVVPAALVLIAALTAPRGFSVHWGVLAAGAAALVLANAALHGATTRRRRPAGPQPV